MNDNIGSAKFIEGLRKNISSDNFELYLLKDKDRDVLVSLYDPYDYLSDPSVLDTWEVGPGII